MWISGMPGAGETGEKRVIADEMDSGETLSLPDDKERNSVEIFGAWGND